VDPQLLLPLGAGLVVEQVQLRDEIVHLTVRCEAAGASCPKCGRWSEAFHSSYERGLGDLPIAGRQAVIDLRIRRFRCYQSNCPRKTFAEQAPVLAGRYAHRTHRLQSMLETIGFSLGGRPGSRHCTRLAMPTSRTTLLRLVRAVPEAPIESPRVLGVDEFAVRRGQRYGTILVDADARKVVDMLEDPSADALVGWLAEHAGTEVICRDRDGVYANAARRGAPGAVQVADRWHLTHNLAQALERFSGRELAMLRPEWIAEHATEPTPPYTPPSRPDGPRMMGVAQRHTEVHALLKQGLHRAAIARRLNLRWATVNKYALAPSAEPLIRSCRFRTKLDPFLPFLAQRWSEGEHVAATLFNEVRAQGYRGKERTVRARLSEWRTAAPPRPAEARLPGPRTLCWLLLRRPSDLNDDERELLKKLCARSDEVANAHRLAQQFLRLVRDRPGGRKLDQWAVAVRKTGPPELRGFSRNLQRDWHAVSAGVTERWSSGPVEGHINKLKMIKRQMFGRARFDLLRKRVLLAN
jgi:transposase